MEEQRNRQTSPHRPARPRWIPFALAAGMALILALVAGITILIAMSGEGGSPPGGRFLA